LQDCWLGGTKGIRPVKSVDIHTDRQNNAIDHLTDASDTAGMGKIRVQIIPYLWLHLCLAYSCREIKENIFHVVLMCFVVRILKKFENRMSSNFTSISPVMDRQ